MIQAAEIKVRPVRFVPFDLGGTLSAEAVTQIRQYLNRQHVLLPLTAKQVALLSKQPLVASVQLRESRGSRLDLYIFDNGIGLYVLHEPEETYPMDAPTFVSRYLQNRREAHRSILQWTHPLSEDMSTVLDELRRIVSMQQNTAVRPSASPSWENRGLSYVMTVAFITPPRELNPIREMFKLPDPLVRSIPVLLNPSIIYMEDSQILSHHHMPDREQLNALIAAAQQNLVDYELRNDVSTYMSWAAVVVVGNITPDIYEDYVALEVELQHYWYYVYCLEHSLPSYESIVQKGTKLSVEQLVAMKFESELIEENIRYVKDSSIPERYELLIDGLIKSSGLSEELRRYRRKLDFFKELLTVQLQSRQRILNQSSELLLAAVAYLQIAPTLYSYLGHDIGMHPFFRYLVLIIAFGIIGVILVLKNRH
jgi:hypothetical protein